MNLRSSKDELNESPKRKSLQFWQNQEQESIRSRRNSLSKSNSGSNLNGSPNGSKSPSRLASSTGTTAILIDMDKQEDLQANSKEKEDLTFRFQKLVSLTGRKESLTTIQPLLNPKTQEEASVMGQKILQSDKMKQIYGTRPPLAPVEKSKSLEKLSRLTGRTDSLQDISDYLNPKNPDEARSMAKSIERSDKMKKVFGERPRSPEDEHHHNGSRSGSPTSDEVASLTNSEKSKTNVTQENVTQVISDIIKENQELKVRASTMLISLKEEEEKRMRAETEKVEMEMQLLQMKKQLEELQKKTDG